MEALLQSAKDVMNQLKKNDEHINRILKSALEIKNNAANFEWTSQQLTDIDENTDTKSTGLQFLGSHTRLLGEADDDDDDDNNNNIRRINQEILSLRRSNAHLIKENERLSTILLETNSVLEFIVKKYRDHLLSLLCNQDPKQHDDSFKFETLNKLLKDNMEMKDQISNMRCVMEDAIKRDTEASREEIEMISQLITENTLLRKTLNMKEYVEKNGIWIEMLEMKKKQLEADESDHVEHLSQLSSHSEECNQDFDV